MYDRVPGPSIQRKLLMEQGGLSIHTGDELGATDENWETTSAQKKDGRVSAAVLPHCLIDC